MDKKEVITKIRSRISYNAPVVYTYTIICMLLLGITSIFSGLLTLLQGPATFEWTQVSFWVGLFSHIL